MIRSVVNILPGDADAADPEKHSAGDDDEITHRSSLLDQSVPLWAGCGGLFCIARVEVIFLHSERLGGKKHQELA